MFQIVKKTNFNFLRIKKTTFFISALVIFMGMVSMIIRGGPNFGIDFVGGTIIQVRFEKDIDIGAIRNSLSTVNLGNSEIKEFGNSRDVSIKTEVQQTEKASAETVRGVLTRDFPDNPYEIRRIEEVGPKIGGELIRGAIWSVLFAFFLMLIYISWRFEFKFAIGAVAALVHDVLITLAVFSFLHLEFSLPVIAAILTLVGYSLNDTIVVFDRIRENLKTLRREKYDFIFNRSINDVLSRTIITSLTTLFVIVVIFIFGGEVIHNFIFALLIGIITGTYSSIYIASPIVAIWKQKTDTGIRKRL